MIVDRNVYAYYYLYMNRRHEYNSFEASSQPNTDETFSPEETSPFTIDSLLERLDIHPSPELEEAREALITGLRDSSTDNSSLSQAWKEYALIAEGIIAAQDREKQQPDDYASKQIAFILHKADIFREVGDDKRYVEELRVAEEYAYNTGLDGLSDSLLIEISENSHDT